MTLLSLMIQPQEVLILKDDRFWIVEWYHTNTNPSNQLKNGSFGFLGIVLPGTFFLSLYKRIIAFKRLRLY